MKQTAIHLCGVFFALLFGWMTGFSAHAAVSDAVLEKEIGTVSEGETCAIGQNGSGFNPNPDPEPGDEP